MRRGLARRAGLPVEIIPRSQFSTREAFSERTFEVCRRAGAGLVTLGGYLQLLKIPEDYRLKVLNIHPALLKAPNVVLLPHLGSATVEAREAMGRQAILNIEALIDGREPPNRVA